MGHEFELKYRATPEQLQTVRQTVGGTFRKIQMETTYYDTPSGALSAIRYTLRHRMENGIAVCTVKTPDSGHGRGEWECRCEEIAKSIDLLCQMGAPEQLKTLTSEGLVPICGAKFTRLGQTVAIRDGTAEVALDQGILSGGSREIAFCEVEVEQKTGSEAQTVSYALDLAEKAGLVPEEKSKFRRALDLAMGEKNG